MSKKISAGGTVNQSVTITQRLNLFQRDNKSNFNDQRRIKIFAELVWVAPLISQYAG